MRPTLHFALVALLTVSTVLPACEKDAAQRASPEAYLTYCEDEVDLVVTHADDCQAMGDALLEHYEAHHELLTDLKAQADPEAKAQRSSDFEAALLECGALKDTAYVSAIQACYDHPAYQDARRTLRDAGTH